LVRRHISYASHKRHRKAIARALLPILTLTAAAALSSATVAKAEPPAPAEVTAEEQALSAEKRSRLIELLQTGATDSEIQQQLGLTKVSSGDDDASSRSDSSAISISRPSIYYDTGLRAYYASSDYRWNNQGTTGDGSAYGGNVGGYDALSIRFSQDVVNVGTSASICPGNWSGLTPYPPKPKCIVPATAENSEDGAAFRYQDKVVGAKCRGSERPDCRIYVGAKGTIVFTFRRIAGGCLQVFSNHAHTWVSTTISGLSVSNSSFNINFSSAANQWQRTSQAGLQSC
jgi:hypothetical protein